jgi:hypothetical protein
MRDAARHHHTSEITAVRNGMVQASDAARRAEA